MSDSRNNPLNKETKPLESKEEKTEETTLKIKLNSSQVAQYAPQVMRKQFGALARLFNEADFTKDSDEYKEQTKFLSKYQTSFDFQSYKQNLDRSTNTSNPIKASDSPFDSTGKLNPWVKEYIKIQSNEEEKEILDFIKKLCLVDESIILEKDGNYHPTLVKLFTDICDPQTNAPYIDLKPGSDLLKILHDNKADIPHVKINLLMGITVAYSNTLSAMGSSDAFRMLANIFTRQKNILVTLSSDIETVKAFIDEHPHDDASEEKRKTSDNKFSNLAKDILAQSIDFITNKSLTNPGPLAQLATLTARITLLKKIASTQESKLIFEKLFDQLTDNLEQFKNNPLQYKDLLENTSSIINRLISYFNAINEISNILKDHEESKEDNIKSKILASLNLSKQAAIDRFANLLKSENLDDYTSFDNELNDKRQLVDTINEFQKKNDAKKIEPELYNILLAQINEAIKSNDIKNIQKTRELLKNINIMINSTDTLRTDHCKRIILSLNADSSKNELVKALGPYLINPNLNIQAQALAEKNPANDKLKKIIDKLKHQAQKDILEKNTTNPIDPTLLAIANNLATFEEKFDHSDSDKIVEIISNLIDKIHSESHLKVKKFIEDNKVLSSILHLTKQLIKLKNKQYADHYISKLKDQLFEKIAKKLENYAKGEYLESGESFKALNFIGSNLLNAIEYLDILDKNTKANEKIKKNVIFKFESFLNVFPTTPKVILDLEALNKTLTKQEGYETDDSKSHMNKEVLIPLPSMDDEESKEPNEDLLELRKIRDNLKNNTNLEPWEQRYYELITDLLKDFCLDDTTIHSILSFARQVNRIKVDSNPKNNYIDQYRIGIMLLQEHLSIQRQSQNNFSNKEDARIAKEFYFLEYHKTSSWNYNYAKNISKLEKYMRGEKLDLPSLQMTQIINTPIIRKLRPEEKQILNPPLDKFEIISSALIRATNSRMDEENILTLIYEQTKLAVFKNEKKREVRDIFSDTALTEPEKDKLIYDVARVFIAQAKIKNPEAAFNKFALLHEKNAHPFYPMPRDFIINKNLNSESMLKYTDLNMNNHLPTLNKKNIENYFKIILEKYKQDDRKNTSGKGQGSELKSDVSRAYIYLKIPDEKNDTIIPTFIKDNKERYPIKGNYYQVNIEDFLIDSNISLTTIPFILQTLIVNLIYHQNSEKDKLGGIHEILGTSVNCFWTDKIRSRITPNENKKTAESSEDQKPLTHDITRGVFVSNLTTDSCLFENKAQAAIDPTSRVADFEVTEVYSIKNKNNEDKEISFDLQADASSTVMSPAAYSLILQDVNERFSSMKSEELLEEKIIETKIIPFLPWINDKNFQKQFIEWHNSQASGTQSLIFTALFSGLDSVKYREYTSAYTTYEKNTLAENKLESKSYQPHVMPASSPVPSAKTEPKSEKKQPSVSYPNTKTGALLGSLWGGLGAGFVLTAATLGLLAIPTFGISLFAIPVIIAVASPIVGGLIGGVMGAIKDRWDKWRSPNVKPNNITPPVEVDKGMFKEFTLEKKESLSTTAQIFSGPLNKSPTSSPDSARHPAPDFTESNPVDSVIKTPAPDLTESKPAEPLSLSPEEITPQETIYQRFSRGLEPFILQQDINELFTRTKPIYEEIIYTLLGENVEPPYAKPETDSFTECKETDLQRDFEFKKDNELLLITEKLSIKKTGETAVRIVTVDFSSLKFEDAVKITQNWSQKENTTTNGIKLT